MNDEWTPTFVDDPAPPEPDAAVLARVVGRGWRRKVRRRAIGASVAVVAVVLVGSGIAVANREEHRSRVHTETPTPPGPVVNGWVAMDGNDGHLYLVRPGAHARRLKVAGSDTADDACPTWSADGTRLSFGRLTGSPDTASSHAELVIVRVGLDGTPTAPTVIALDGFHTDPGFDPHPCATWASDGRWVAFAGGGEVWVADTRTGATRRLPGLRPTDLEWRPDTHELAIAGDIGPNRDAETSSTPVTVYSVSTLERRSLGAVRAASLTWSPDGSKLAYRGGENDPDEIRVVDADGANDRLLAHDGRPLHGVGPMWSPTGDRVAFQRTVGLGLSERTEVVLVNVADGTETVIEPPQTDGPNGPESWYPWHVTWSPDGATLLYSAWSKLGGGCCGGTAHGVIAVSADTPTHVTVLTDAMRPSVPYSYGWVPIQMWGRQPG
jgi:WD40-like Beta Propeller Repeat